MRGGQQNSMQSPGPSLTERVSIFMGAVFLFGLAALFMMGFIWPGILILAWLTAIPILLVEQGWLGAWVIVQMTIWLVGLPLAIMAGAVFPGILILAGASALLTAVFHPSDLDKANQQRRQGEKTKRKRSMPLPYEGDNHHETYDTGDDWQPDTEYDPDADEHRLRARRH